MTPFGLKSRRLRSQKGVTLQEQADVLGVSAAIFQHLSVGKGASPHQPLLIRYAFGLA